MHGILSQLKPQMALFHKPRSRKQTHATGNKNRLGIAVAEWLKLAQPAGDHGRDAVQWQFGVNAQPVFALASR